MRYVWKMTGMLLMLAAGGMLGNLAQAQQGCGSCGSCGNSCLVEPARCHCPTFEHTQEGPPRIHYSCGCGRPVCNPCDLPHFGYFQPCWRRWPYPPDYSHCRELPLAATIIPGPVQSSPGYLPGGEVEPQPRPKSNVPPGAEKLPQPLPGVMSVDPPSIKYY